MEPDVEGEGIGLIREQIHAIDRSHILCRIAHQTEQRRKNPIVGALVLAGLCGRSPAGALGTISAAAQHHQGNHALLDRGIGSAMGRLSLLSPLVKRLAVIRGVDQRRIGQIRVRDQTVEKAANLPGQSVAIAVAV